MTTGQVKPPTALEKLPPEEREKFIAGWKSYLGGLPKEAYVGQLTKLTQEYGPDFTSALVQPSLPTTKPEAPPVTEVPAAEIEPEIPWYAKPLMWAAEQPALKPLVEGMEKYYGNWITPAAMTVAKPFAPKLRAQMEGQKLWSMPTEERREMWAESGLPWITKTAIELAVDPLSYFGWGLAPKAMKAAQKAGYTGLASAIKPIASAEAAYIKAAGAPIRAAGRGLKKLPAIIPDIAELRATGKLIFRKPIEESSRSIINNLPTHTYDLLHNLGLAGEITGKPFSQILENLRMGITDDVLFATIKSPQQKRALEYLIKNANKLDLDMLIKIADAHPDTAASVIGWKQVGLVAKELKLPAPRMAPGILGSFQKMGDKLYSLWRRTVLQTPYYVLQNTVENPIREILVGVRPLLDITDFAKLPSFGNHPMDIQRRVISLADRWNKKMPAHLTGPFARTPATGGVTEAVTGAVAIGKAFPASTVAAYMDDTAIVNTYFNYFDRFTKTLMENTSPQTSAALAKITGLYDDAIISSSAGFKTRAMTTAEEATRAGTAFYDPTLNQIVLSKTATEFTKYHEIGHVLIANDIVPRSDLLSWVKVQLKNKIKVTTVTHSADDITDDIIRYTQGKTPQLIEGRDFGELFAEDYKQFITGTRTSMVGGITPETRRIFERVLPAEYGIDVKLLEHLKQSAISGSVDDFIGEMARVQRNKTLTIARAMNNLEKSLPDVIKSTIRNGLPRHWAKNDISGIHVMFESLRRTLPQRIETYQKQVMVQRLRSYRNLLRTSVPKKYQPFVTKVLNSFKLDRVSEAEAKISSAKSLSEFQQAMFKASLASRRELEALAEATIITEAIARNVDDKVLMAWYQTGQAINQTAFKAGEELVDQAFSLSNTIRFAKNPGAIRKSWDNFIMTIQSEFPEIAASMRSIATPDADSLWSAYRSVQERRWFNVGQEKLVAMGIDFNQFPRTIGAKGQLLTQEDFLTSQLQALKGWEDRVVSAWDKRHIAPTAKNKLLDTLREGTIAAKEGIALQARTIQNEAQDLALNVTYSTFGNYAQRTNLDDFMMGVGVPFWFFPSRSIPFYITQMIQRPRLGIEILKLQNEAATSEQPSRLFGTIKIPGTNYWYNPIQSTMLWQLADRRNFVPAAVGGLEQGQSWLRNTLGVSLGPQWLLATALVERVMGKQANETIMTMEPQPIIPQQRWLKAVANLRLPIVSPVVALLNEPFDMYLRAVFGDDVANWQKREVEKTIVDMGYNPLTAPDDIIEKAWDKYYIRQLLSIPGGAVKRMTPTETARFEAINEKAKDLDLTREQRVTLRQLGESPFVGLRNDQLEALYADIPAQKLWRYIRPWGLTTKSRPIWDDYIQFKLGRETLLYGADKNNPTEGSRLYKEHQYDEALQLGKISPRAWKALYRQNYADYISRVDQLATDFPLSPKTKEDWEAYRQLLGWDEPVRHPDDIKLDEYYTAMESSKFEDELGQFDYGAYRQAETTFLKGLSPDTITYIRTRKDRYKSPMRAAYTRDMGKVQPYYDLQSDILKLYPPEITMVIEYALASPDPAIQRAILIGNPEAMMVLRRIRIAKAQLRARNPEMDKILRYWSS